MIKLPVNNRFTQPNNSDLFGSIWYTKNINLDEEGYIKVSPRLVSILSEKDNTDLGAVLAFGRKGSLTETFYTVTSGEPFITSLSNTTASAALDSDSGVPSTTTDSHGRWFHNLWIVTDDNDFFAKDPSTGAYLDKGNLTSGKVHPIEVFKNKNRICFGDGNTVKMYSESAGTFTLELTLTLPEDFEVIGLSYSNYQMGVITKLADGTSGQNQDAFFFVWDGSATEAGQGIPIGSDRSLSITPYKGSYAVLTRTGQLLFFSGGNFQELGSLPFYYQDLVFGDSTNREVYTDTMHVEGDVIYFKFPGWFEDNGSRYEVVSQNNPGGILCYDPKVGIYHRYSGSISAASVISVADSNVNTTTDILTATSGTIPTTGNPIKYISSKSNQIGGLKVPNVYYVIRHTSTTFSLAETKEDAIAGNKIDITSQGETLNSFLGVELYDFGQSIERNSGAISVTGARKETIDHIISGSDLSDFESADTTYNHINISVDGFENRGYFVTPKVISSGTEDGLQKAQISFRPLKEGEEIIVKYKDEELLDFPVSTPQQRGVICNQCSWTSTTTFTTTADLSAVKTAFDNSKNLECEVVGGAGAGVMSQITDISESGGTYTVTLEDEVTGASSGRKCDVIIDNWTYLDTATSDDEGYKEFFNDSKSNWYQLKVELRGKNTTIREMRLINVIHKE